MARRMLHNIKITLHHGMHLTELLAIAKTCDNLGNTVLTEFDMEEALESLVQLCRMSAQSQSSSTPLGSPGTSGSDGHTSEQVENQQG
jgi:hypothetical protein